MLFLFACGFLQLERVCPHPVGSAIFAGLAGLPSAPAGTQTTERAICVAKGCFRAMLAMGPNNTTVCMKP